MIVYYKMIGEAENKIADVKICGTVENHKDALCIHQTSGIELLIPLKNIEWYKVLGGDTQ